jgi:hypothetical protein
MIRHAWRGATLVAVVFVVLFASVASGQVKSPWVTTDRTVDCSSYETILEDVLEEGMSDEEKAIALYNFYRQMVYHYKKLPESRDPIKCINVMGNTLCGSQATCMKGLLTKAGFKARVVSHPGHTFYEVFYDGKWHGFDTMTNFYVFTRGEDRNVASFEELHKDPSLIKTAKKEGRACPGMTPCGDNPMRFARKTKITDYGVRDYNYSPKDYSLRKGEQIVRTWRPLGFPLPGSYRPSRNPGPMHTCGNKDRKNPPELFKYWEPYGIPKYGGVSISYRHYTNGYMEYSPDLSGGEIAAALKEGEWVIPVKCPYYITAARLAFQAECPGTDDAVKASISMDGKSFKPVHTASKEGVQEYTVRLDDHVVRRYKGRHKYYMKFTVEGEASLKNMNLKTVFSHNAMAAPQLMPGKNEVTVTAANGEQLAETPLTVIYRYKKAPNWVDLVKVEKKIEKSPESFTVELAETEKLPQMQDLTLRVGEIDWRPEKEEAQAKVICDFSDPAEVKKWAADAELTLSHDGKGMLIDAEETRFGQAWLGGLDQDWSDYRSVVIEAENIGPKPQMLVLRVQSNDTNKQRTDVHNMLAKGKKVITVPISGLKKTKADNITKLYLMPHRTPKEGSKIRLLKIYLEPKQGL